MATQAEIQADAAAFEAWTKHMLEQRWMMWAFNFIPHDSFAKGASAVVDAADKNSDQSSAGRQGAAFHALRAALDASGQGGRVSDEQCRAGSDYILQADAAWKAKHMPAAAAKPAVKPSA